MPPIRKKINCRKCKKNYYQLEVGKSFCPYCARDALVPNDTIAILQLTIQHGGYNDDNLCLDSSLASKAQSGNIYLRGLVTVLSGKHKNKKFTLPIGISGKRIDQWRNNSRKLIRNILNSSQGLSPSHNSRKAVFGRIIDSYKVLDGIAFVGVVGVKKGRLGRDENTILKILSGDDDDYKDLVAKGVFVPAQKFLPPSEPSMAAWRRA
tara:strand:- start:215 stop:838 length:624 start_codon:yes stop_codon:yes gene_type:complete